MSAPKRKAAACAAALFVLCSAAELFAVPGIEAYLPDIAGAYVYYRDYSFTDEAYVGILQYDETTYCIRFYADSLQGSSAPYTMELYFTLGQAESGKPEMTGERVIASPARPDIVNYLHDIVYEFSARRSAVPAASLSQSAAKFFTGNAETPFDESALLRINEEYPQFGGSVYVHYAFFVPVFNIYGITAENGEQRLELVTAAVLSAAEDSSFFDFAGIPQNPQDTARQFTLEKQPEQLEIRDEHQTFTIDSQWKLAAPGMWLLGDAAVLTYSSAQTGLAEEQIPDYAAYMLRTMLLGTQGAYPDLRTIDIRAAKDSFTIETRTYLPTGAAVSHSSKQFSVTQSGAACLFDLTVFDSVYSANMPYFTGILDTYRCR